MRRSRFTSNEHFQLVVFSPWSLELPFHPAKFTSEVISRQVVTLENSRHFATPPRITSEERAQKFHTDDVTLLL